MSCRETLCWDPLVLKSADAPLTLRQREYVCGMYRWFLLPGMLTQQLGLLWHEGRVIYVRLHYTKVFQPLRLSEDFFLSDAVGVFLTMPTSTHAKRIFSPFSFSCSRKKKGLDVWCRVSHVQQTTFWCLTRETQKNGQSGSINPSVSFSYSSSSCLYTAVDEFAK